MQTRTSGLLFALLLTTSLTPRAKAADAEPHVIKPSLSIMVTRYLRYFPTPTAKEPVYNTWSWRPRFNFTIAGPLASGSQISIAFYKPDGSPWLTMPCPAQEISEGQTVNIVNPNDSTPEAERHTTLATGTFSFKINLKNPLTGTDKMLYTGKFTVNKFHVGPNVPANKNQFDYYVEHDWLLPIGYLFWNIDPQEQAPQVKAMMWLRGELKTEQVAAYLFYNGKPICSTANREQGSSYAPYSLITPSDAPDPRWMGYVFHFARVATTNRMTSANQYPNTFFLDKNPGDYEIKVLIKGQLARVASFKVGADGQVVDNGIASSNGMAGLNMILPVKVIPGADVKAVPTTYKTDAYYGNPLVGFVVP
jgi:hypothetical protein